MMDQNYLTRQSFETYKLFLALQRHFTTEGYDFFKYHGQVKVSTDAFQRRKDRAQFHFLSKKKDPKGLMIANMIIKPRIWVGELLDQHAQEVYLEWKGRNESIGYGVDMALGKLGGDFLENFVVRGGKYPRILELYMAGEVSLEVFALLVKLTDALPMWRERVSDKIVAGDVFFLLGKYTQFIRYDMRKLSEKVVTYFGMDI